MFYVDDIMVYFLCWRHQSVFDSWFCLNCKQAMFAQCRLQTQFQLNPMPTLTHCEICKKKPGWVKARWQGRLNGTLNRPLAFDIRLKSNIEPELISPMIHTWWSRLHWPSNWTQKRPFQLFMSWIFLECCPLCWIFLSYHARGFFHPRWTTVRHEHVT